MFPITRSLFALTRSLSGKSRSRFVNLEHNSLSEEELIDRGRSAKLHLGRSEPLFLHVTRFRWYLHLEMAKKSITGFSWNALIWSKRNRLFPPGVFFLKCSCKVSSSIARIASLSFVISIGKAINFVILEHFNIKFQPLQSVIPFIYWTKNLNQIF